MRSTPAVANGTVYAVNGSGYVRAFDANGVTGCGSFPKVCSPLWTYAPTTESGYSVDGSPALANGLVYTVTPGSNFRALDANGVTNCGSSPRVCSPLWSTTSGKISTAASPAIVDGTVYWNSTTVSATWAYSLP